MTHSEVDLPAEHDFGAWVKDARELRGWSQEVLARRLKEASGLDLHQTAIARLERGDRAIRLNEAAGLAHVLGLDLGRYGSALPALTEAQYGHAVKELETVRTAESALRDQLEVLRQERDAAIAQLERDIQSWRDQRVNLEAMIRRYEGK